MDETIKKIEQDLINMRKEILQTMQQQQEEIKDSLCANDVPKDSADLASDDTDQNILQTLSAAEYLRLSKIDAALVKIHAGTYGTCSSCGKAINPARLEAMPFAVLCIDCQKLSDKHSN